VQTLFDLAHREGIRIVRSRLPKGVLGCWLPRQHTIHLDAGLTRVEARTVLAHELGHAYHGHLCSTSPTHRRVEADERQADRFAARVLIDPDEYARHERSGSDQHAIAAELGVTIDLIRVYQQHCLTRLEGVTYAHAREGLNQWAYRQSVA
jgi:Zn-dependent peptidase ImmA (M78 family)